MLDKFKNDKFFEYNINNMPYIYEFISPGNFICKNYDIIFKIKLFYGEKYGN